MKFEPKGYKLIITNKTINQGIFPQTVKTLFWVIIIESRAAHSTHTVCIFSTITGLALLFGEIYDYNIKM